MKIIICMLLFFSTVLVVSSNEYLKKENALEKADQCLCKNGKCVPDKKGKLVCTCSGDYYLSGSECTKCDCGKGSAGCTFTIGIKSCVCKKGYKNYRPFLSNKARCNADCKKDTCNNGGVCQKKGDEIIECKCKPPFEGEYCEKKIIPTTVKPKTSTTIKKTTPVTSTVSTKSKIPSTVSTKRPTTRNVAPTTKKTSPVPVTTLKSTKRTLPTTTQKKTTVQTTTKKATPTTKKTSPVPVTTLETTKRTLPTTTQKKTTDQSTTKSATPTTKKTSPVPVTTLKTTKRTLPSTTEKQHTINTTTNATTRSTTQVTTRPYNRTTPMPVTISETKKRELSSTILTKPFTPQMSTTNTTTRTMYSTTAKVSYTALKTSPVTTTAPKFTTKQSTSITTANTSPKLTTIRLVTNNTMSVTTEKITQKKTSSWPISTPESTTKMKKSTSQSVRPTTATRNVTFPIIHTTLPTSSPTKMRSTMPSTSTHLKTEVVTFTKSFTDELLNETTTELNTTDVNTINDSNETTAELNSTEVFTDGLVTSTSSYITSNGNDTQTTISETVNTVPKFITTDGGNQTVVTTIPRVYNCTTLPCKNGGTCVEEEHSTKCICPHPYRGMRCTLSFWCTEGEGKDLCGSAKCDFNFDTKVGRCVCKKAFYFDYNKKSCELVDLCPLQPDKCKGAHKLCLKNECVCEENFKRNEKDECIPNYCVKHSDICAEYNATCEENEKDPINVKCVCRENEVFNGKICVKVNKCDVPSILGCQQICNSTSEQCECNAGFSLDKDGKSCTLTADGPQKCDYNCTPGICVKYNDSEACLCPPTHAYEEGICQDLCSAQLLPQNLCPGDACEPHPTLGFRCKCEDKLTYNEDNFTCRRKLMCSEGDGDKICANRSAKCIEDFDSVDGFMCICEDSEEMDLDGICKKQCDLQSYQENCWGQRAMCEMDGDKAICKCPPLLAKGKNGYCEELAEASYMGSMPFAKKNQEVVVMQDVNNQSIPEKQYFAMKQKLRDSMRLIFGENYKFADIFDCSDFGFYYKCKVEIQFKSDPEGQVNLISDSETCIRNGPTTCYIPPALVLYSKNLRPDLLSRSDPCSKEIKLVNCGGRETVCNSTEDKSHYQCTCSEGFSSYSTIYPVTDRRTVIHRCEDVNECLNPRACPNRTRCLNTYGSYDCVCQQGFRPNGTNANPKISGCVGLCHGVSCGNGKCKEDGFEYQCICDEGYSGEKCKEKVNLSGSSKGAEVALIVMSTIVIPLLLFAIFMVHKYQILRKKVFGSGYLDDGSSTITMEPLTPLNLRD